MIPKFDLVESKKAFHDGHWCIRILDGEYEGLVYQYDTVRIEEDDEGAVLHFNTITVENPNNADLTEENDKHILGGILTAIIEEELNQLDKEQDENGTPDTEESAAQ